MSENIVTREAWLHRAIESLRHRFAEVGMPIPDRVHVSVGFGFGAKSESSVILGQCWAARASEDYVNHIFISPVVNDTARVLDILIHELIHASDDCHNGHKGPFAEAATRLGLEGPMTATRASVHLAAEMMCLADSLGPYPHGALVAADRSRAKVPAPAGRPGGPGADGGRISSGPAKQGTRMLKLVCAEADCDCYGYTVRTTAKWIERGVPFCPNGHPMVQE